MSLNGDDLLAEWLCQRINNLIIIAYGTKILNSKMLQWERLKRIDFCTIFQDVQFTTDGPLKQL